MRRCTKTDLPTSQCAHCTGHRLPAGAEPAVTEVNPFPLPRAVPVTEVPPEQPPIGPRFGVLAELDDLYQRLFESLPAESRGRSTDNAAAYAASPDPRRAPVRVEVLDLIHRIEADVPEFARMVCEALAVVRCVAFPHDSASGAPEVSPRVLVSLDTLARHWGAFEEAMPEVAEGVTEALTRMVSSARRLLGQTSAPVPLATPCPACAMPTVFRIETERGQVAVCGNPGCRDELGRARQWTETEWEDAHPRRPLAVHPR